MKKLRLLLIAEACNPQWTSVPLVGYNFARALAEREDLDIVLATHPRNREVLEQDRLSRLVRVVYPDNEYVAARGFAIASRLRGGMGKGWTTNTAFKSVCYLFFEWELKKLLQDELRRESFDLIHRVTPVSPTVGSPLASWTRIPMILGPINGGLPWPNEFPELRREEKEFLVPFRKTYRLLPYYRATYRRIKAVLAGSRFTLSEVPASFSGERIFLPENGVDPCRFELADDWTPPKDRFQFVTVGRLVPYKGLSLTLEAMRRSQKLKDAQLVVIGDGPDRPRIEAMIREYDLCDRVKMMGWIDQREMSRVLRASQCFVFPSLREFGGGVVVEAMASGLPSIIVNYGGPADLMGDESGIRLPLTTKNTLIEDLQRAMEQLLDDPGRCRDYAQRALERVKTEFTWEAKATRLNSIYHEILGDREACHPQTQVEPSTTSDTSALIS